MNHLPLLKGLLLALTALPALSAHRYELVPLGSLDGYATYAVAMNNSNQVVGFSTLYNVGPRAFL